MAFNTPVFGLTGGIGSGKSTAASAFRSHGITVVDADQVAREPVEPGSPALETIEEHFGPSILTASGQLNRPALRQIIFQNPAEKQWLENLLHPIIRALIIERLQAADAGPYKILESPLLLETDQRTLVSGVILVDVSPELQIARASQRDNNTPAQIEAIVASQMPRDEKLALADYVLTNDGAPSALVEQVARLHTRLVASLNAR
ncbi:dephospho-CoA kinase [Simiduia sp. 21SJ11W-1]|uniref:dephospho-CoA kinase n=1 Tax=Simiduia sp. 21SJ11W-1 TaxID=2909669 RepID=UPI0020A1612A|nr:dephospho-CoA kinase [Simiduia sp. 21SJ11W-1]UTA48881.1 dephospho-CoA kinase [Simiduia sp. 21SJ11W-1]